jgi:hypothetical protein
LRFKIRDLASVFLFLGAILALARTCGLEWLLLVFPAGVFGVSAIFRNAPWAVPTGALAGVAAGVVCFTAVALVWWYAPMESSVADEPNANQLIYFGGCAVIGSVVGLLLGGLCGLREQLKRWGWTGVLRDAPAIGAFTLVATWAAGLYALSIDPWIYVNGARDDFIPFEGRIVLVLYYGTFFAVLAYPVALLAAAAAYALGKFQWRKW